jgi:hypothetical protein|tara:strand:- start:5640 stop:5861 length:222 start_codon:yes stop_codon:yes gene_type:complete
MLQQFINWFWSKGAQSDNDIPRINAAITIEKAYLNYKSNQRIKSQVDSIINGIIKDIYTKSPLYHKPKQYKLQ